MGHKKPPNAAAGPGKRTAPIESPPTISPHPHTPTDLKRGTGHKNFAECRRRAGQAHSTYRDPRLLFPNIPTDLQRGVGRKNPAECRRRAGQAHSTYRIPAYHFPTYHLPTDLQRKWGIKTPPNAAAGPGKRTAPIESLPTISQYPYRLAEEVGHKNPRRMQPQSGQAHSTYRDPHLPFPYIPAGLQRGWGRKNHCRVEPQGRVSGHGCPRKTPMTGTVISGGPISPEAQRGKPRERPMIQPDHPRRGDARGARLRAPCAVAAAGPQKGTGPMPTQHTSIPIKKSAYANATTSRSPPTPGCLTAHEQPNPSTVPH